MPRLVPAVQTEEVIYVPEDLEPGTGRTPRQVRDMERNKPKALELDPRDKAYARQIAKKEANYPKVMYIAAKYKRISNEEFGDEIIFIDGDVKTPMYHSYNQILRGKTIQVFDRHPYKTISVKTETEEKSAAKKGYVESPALLKYEWQDEKELELSNGQ